MPPTRLQLALLLNPTLVAILTALMSLAALAGPTVAERFAEREQIEEVVLPPFSVWEARLHAQLDAMTLENCTIDHEALEAWPPKPSVRPTPPRRPYAGRRLPDSDTIEIRAWGQYEPLRTIGGSSIQALPPPEPERPETWSITSDVTW